MQIKLRDYQTKVIKTTLDYLKDNQNIVIGAAPSSGKTEIAIELMSIYSNKKILLLPHGTSAIKNQWKNRLPFMNNITVMLHQELNSKSKKELDFISQFDIIIIDEAHEFTFAKITSKNLSKFKGKIIYLTGTPSKFIRNGNKVEIISALELIKEGYISELYVGLFSSQVKFLESDYMESGNVSISGIKKLEKTVESDLDSLMKSLHSRLSSIFIKDKPDLSQWLGNIRSFGGIGKTLVATDSIKNAHKVYEYFKLKGINSTVSESDTDKNSEEVQKFIESDIEVLVVVNRCILGFNLEKLENVIDMTGSYNIDRIYQLYARVMRKDSSNPEKKKYFFKLVPEDKSDFYKFYMTAALCLMEKDFISKYNGKNLNGMQIPVRIIKSNPRKKGESKPSNNKKEVAIDLLFSEVVSSTNLLIDIYNKQGTVLNEYAFNTLGGIVSRLEGSRDAIDWKNIDTLYQSLIEKGHLNA